MAGKYNVKAQYGAWIAAATLATVLALTAVDLWRTFGSEEASLQRAATLLARVAARAVAPAVVSTNNAGVTAALQQVVEGHDVTYVRVLDWNQRVVFVSIHPGPALVSEPILSGTNQVGVLELSLARGGIYQRVMGSLLWNLGIGVVLFAVFTFGSVLVSAPVGDALRSLNDFVKRVSNGEARGEVVDSELREVDDVARTLTELMRRVADAQQRLERAQKQVKSTQKEMDEYTYVISHDLKEPLRGIEGFSKLLAEGYRDKLDDDARHHIDVIRNSTLRMQRLINDLLKFSRLSQQKQPMELVGLNATLMHVRVNLQFALDAKHADLRVNKLPMVVCDATALTEVFHNLISNAIKYNDKPVPIIEISCEEQPHPDTGQPEYVFSVRDNGVGIKKEYFEKIFQIFQRLHSDQEGTGIGLSIVKRVIEWHGGRLWLESEEGKGTTFYFTIPKREIGPTGTIVEAPAAVPAPEAKP